jgi:hypothetical protein
MCAIPMDEPRNTYHVGMVLADREPAPLLARAFLDVTQRLDLAREFNQIGTRLSGN